MRTRGARRRKPLSGKEFGGRWQLISEASPRGSDLRGPP